MRYSPCNRPDKRRAGASPFLLFEKQHKVIKNHSAIPRLVMLNIMSLVLRDREPASMLSASWQAHLVHSREEIFINSDETISRQA